MIVPIVHAACQREFRRNSTGVLTWGNGRGGRVLRKANIRGAGLFWTSAARAGYRLPRGGASSSGRPESSESLSPDLPPPLNRPIRAPTNM